MDLISAPSTSSLIPNEQSQLHAEMTALAEVFLEIYLAGLPEQEPVVDFPAESAEEAAIVRV